MDIILNFFADYPAWINALLSICVSATGITILTKNNYDNKVLNIIIKILNILAGNILRIKNSDDYK